MRTTNVLKQQLQLYLLVVLILHGNKQGLVLNNNMQCYE